MKWSLTPRRILANLFIAVGLALIVGTGTLWAYGSYEQQEAKRLIAQEDRDEVSAGGSEGRSARQPATRGGDGIVDNSGAPGSTSPRSGNQRARSAPIKRLEIPKIDVDTRVVEAKVAQGNWLVPKFVAGHLEGTAQPGQGRNVVLAGHVQSISGGNVFARLDELKPGDEVWLYTADGESRYVVRGLTTVKPNDLGVVAPGSEEKLTLVTCTGRWNPITREYSHRLIATAEPVGFTPTP